MIIKLLFLFLLYNPFAISAAPDRGGMQDREVTTSQGKRQYSLYIPSKIRGKKASILFALHGGKGDGGKLETQSELSKEAESRGFILAYPNASGTQWNDGRKETSSFSDDVAFLTSLSKDLQKEFSIDSKRIFVAGISNGGMMALRLACDTENIFSAFAFISASMPKDYLSSCKGKAMPDLLFIGSPSDPLMPWDGGEILKGRFSGKGGEVISFSNALEYWRSRGGCSERPTTKMLPEKDSRDGTSVEHTVFQNCTSGKLELYKVIDGGHPWPSGKGVGPIRQRIVGKTTSEIGNKEILDFFGL